MKNKLIIILMCMFLFLTGTTHAIVNDVYTQASGIGNYIPPEGFTGDPENLILFSNGTDIYRADQSLSSFTKIYENLPGAVSDLASNSNYIYIFFEDADVYKVPNDLSLTDWDTLSSENKEYIGVFSTETYKELSIAVDIDENIYLSVVSDAQDQISKINGNTLASVTWLDSINAARYSPMSMYSGTSFYVFTNENALPNSGEIYEIQTANDPELLFSFTDTTEINAIGISELTNGNFIIAYYCDSTVDLFKIKEFNSTGSEIGTVVSRSGINYDVHSPGDITVTSDGVIIFMNAADSELESFSTYSGAGAYISYSSFSQSELDITGTVSSSQNVYFNNTPLDARVYMDLTGTLNEYNGAKKIVEGRQWELLLYGPGGQIVGRYNAPYSIWDYSNTFEGINFRQHGIFARNVEFADPAGDWPEGTYTFRMTEFTAEDGTSLIAQNTVTVANESGTISPGGIDPDTATADDIFSSTAFKALMFICLPALGLGLVAGLPGALVGLVLGVFLAFSAGLIGVVWVIMTIFAIMVSFAAFARDTMLGGRGGA